jgi:hypothetical protein
MIAKRFCKVFLKGSLIALMLLFALSVAIAGPVTGAIFTTNFDSSFVNGNVYDSKDEVYLNGGPRPNAPCTAAGLPDGYYYFQVTDPSGATLLSLDDVTQRVVHVYGGVIVTLGTTTSHIHGSGKCTDSLPENITVGLSPFDDTSNPGGEYKVWMTLVGSYKPGYGSFGFVPSSSKTDNFKVVAPECPTGSEGCL